MQPIRRHPLHAPPATALPPTGTTVVSARAPESLAVEPADALGSPTVEAMGRPTARPAVSSRSAIPDVAGILASGKRYEALNVCITRSYNEMAPLFQAIVDPTGQNGGAPTWFAIAPYASRSAGQGMTLAHRLRDALDHSATTLTGLVRFAFGPVAGPLAGVAAEAAAQRPPSETDAAGVAALAAHGLASRHDGKQHLADHLALLDPRLMTVTTARLAKLLAHAPGANLREKTEALCTTLLQGLEDGNRGIFADIGTAAAAYLQMRQAHDGQITPDEVLATFSIAGPPQPERAREIFARACAQAEGRQPLPTDLGAEMHVTADDASPMFAASFALYEQAGRTADARVRDRLVMYANNLLLWREQHETAQPAFSPEGVVPGEVDREAVWQLMTPLVDIKTRFGVWRYAEYVDGLEEKGDFDHLLTPAIAKKSWGRFEDRWPAIMDAFDGVYANASAVWPMPNPDPMRGIDEAA